MVSLVNFVHYNVLPHSAHCVFLAHQVVIQELHLRCSLQAAFGRAAPDWSPHRLIATGDKYPSYMRRAIPFVVKVSTEFQLGSGTVMMDAVTRRWFLLTAAHVLHGCRHLDCREETCFAPRGVVTFFDEARVVENPIGLLRAVDLETVEMEFDIDSSASSVWMFSPPARNPCDRGVLTTSTDPDVIAVR